MTERKFDSTLIHVYSQLSHQDSIKLDLRAHMQASAALGMLKRGETKKVFIAGGYIYGKQQPSASEVLARELVRRGASIGAIVINPVARESSEEIEAFLDESQKQGWKRLASIASTKHNTRIGLIHKKLHSRSITRINAEEKLAEISPKYNSFLEELEGSCREKFFSLREKTVIGFYFIFPLKLARLFSKTGLSQSIKNYFDR